MDERLAVLVAERGGALVGYAYLLCGRLSEAEDLVQEGLVRTFSRRRTGADVAWLEAYVRQAILSAYLDGYRKRRRWAGVAHLFATAAEPVAGPDTLAVSRADIRDALALLSPRERACVVARYLDDLSTREVAERLGLSEGAVKRYLSDARARLGEMLDDPDEERGGDHVDVATARSGR